MNILFAIDQKCIDLLFTCVYSLLENGGYKKYNIYVFHSDLNEIHIKKIIDFYYEIQWHFIEIPKEMFDGFPTVKRYPQQIYYRLAAPLLLPKELDRILYLDVDTIVLNTLNYLYETSFEDNLFVACTNTKKILTKFNQIRLGIPIHENRPYVNTGVLLMNLNQLRDELSLEDIREFIKNKKNVLCLPDQDILTTLYGNKVKIINSLQYNLSDRAIMFHNMQIKNEVIDMEWVKKNTVILHYYGNNKPWREDYNGTLGQFYYDIVNKLEKRIHHSY